MKATLLLIVLLSVALTSCAGLDIGGGTGTSIAETAARIANFKPPEGFKPEFAISLDAYTLVSYSPGDGHSHLYLIQSIDAEDKNQLDRAIKNILPGDNERETRMTVIEKRTVTVRGQETTLVLSEGIKGDGNLFFQAMVNFDGEAARPCWSSRPRFTPGIWRPSKI
jgi:hypothetical protein